MSGDIEVTTAQVASAVYGSDSFPTAVRRHLLDQIVHLVLLRLGIATLGGRRVRVDLGNGRFLLVQVERPAQAQPLEHAA